MPIPTLIVVSGPPGTGKTTLAHELGGILGCPAIVRDEIKQGMVLAGPGFTAADHDPFNLATLDVFSNIVATLAKSGVSTVIEAAFQARLWHPILKPLADLADIRVIRCTAPASTAHDRIARRVGQDSHRTAHADRERLDAIAAGEYSIDSFVPISLGLPTLVVDTSEGYSPALENVVEFIRSR